MCYRASMFTARSRARHLSVLLLFWVSVCSVSPLPAATKPAKQKAAKWYEPDFRARAVFSVPKEAGMHLIVEVPSPMAMGVQEIPESLDGYFRVLTEKGRELPATVAFADTNTACLLVNVSGVGKEECHAYFDPGTNQPQRTAEDVRVVDPLPILLSIHSTSRNADPLTWERMLYLYSNSRKSPVTKRIHYIEGLEVPPSRSRSSRGHSSSGSILRLRAALVCEEAGEYVFGVNAAGPVYTLLDGEMRAAAPHGTLESAWSAGAPVRLEPGVHSMEVFFRPMDGARLRLGWKKPSDQAAGKSIAPIPYQSFITASRPDHVRIERLGSTLHPDFTYNVDRVYTYRGLGKVFADVRLKNETVNWIESGATCSWRLESADGRVTTVNNQNEVLHVFDGNGVHRATMVVRDELGFVGSLSREIDTRLTIPREYAFDIELTELPAVCYRNDQFFARLRMTGSLPSQLGFDVTWSLGDDSQTESGSESIPHLDAKRTTYLDLPSVHGGTDWLNWTVAHHGVTLLSEHIRFVDAPFDTVPVQAIEDRLYDAEGKRLVLCPARLRGEVYQSDIAPSDAASVVILDDTLSAPGLPGEGMPEYCALLEKHGKLEAGNLHHIRFDAQQEQETACRSAQRFVEVARLPAQKQGVLVLSIGLQDMLEHMDVDEFQRDAAALTDLAIAVTKRKVVWVTPPPYNNLPVSARAYAKAIRQVADARNIPVADVYTAFRTGDNKEDGPFVEKEDARITKDGHRRVADVLERVLWPKR